MKFIMCIFSIIIGFFYLSTVFAVDAANTDVNVARVAVSDQSQGTLQKMLPQAFAQVLVKMSGDAQITAQPAIKNVLPQANNWVENYQYESEVNASGAAQQYLVVEFDKDGVGQLLRGNGATMAAAQPQTATESHVKLIIAGVNSLDDYAALLKSIQHLPSVVSAHVSNMDASTVLFDVDVQGGKDALENALAQSNQLSPMADMNAVAQNTSLYYQWKTPAQS